MLWLTPMLLILTVTNISFPNLGRSQSNFFLHLWAIARSTARSELLKKWVEDLRQKNRDTKKVKKGWKKTTNERRDNIPYSCKRTGRTPKPPWTSWAKTFNYRGAQTSQIQNGVRSLDASSRLPSKRKGFLLNSFKVGLEVVNTPGFS